MVVGANVEVAVPVDEVVKEVVADVIVIVVALMVVVVVGALVIIGVVGDLVVAFVCFLRSSPVVISVVG